MNTKALIFVVLMFGLAAVGATLIFLDPGHSLTTDHETSADILTAASDTLPKSVLKPSLATGTQEPSLVSNDALKIDGEKAYVKRTVDGDTLDVMIGGNEEKVRLLGINSPESVDPRRAVECYGKEASHQMDQLATHHTVTMVADSTNSDRDKYHRLLRYIYLEDGTFVNAWMVEKGYAFAYTRFPFTHMKEFIALEQKARSQELGLWNSKICPYYGENK